MSFLEIKWVPNLIIMCLYICKVYSLQAKEKQYKIITTISKYNCVLSWKLNFAWSVEYAKNICDFTEEKKFTGANIYYTYIFINIIYCM